MRGVILAAGRGERLRPITGEIPKPMIPIDGRPIIEWVVRFLVDHGVDDLVVNLHHLPDVITAHLGDGSRFAARIAYLRESRLLGTARTLGRLPGLDEPFLVALGDQVYDGDLAPLLEGHATRGPALTMATIHRDDVRPSGWVRADASGEVVEFVEKPPLTRPVDGAVNAGLMVLAPSVVGLIRAHDWIDLAADAVVGLLAEGLPVHAVPFPGTVRAVDTPADYARWVEARPLS